MRVLRLLALIVAISLFVPKALLLSYSLVEGSPIEAARYFIVQFYVFKEALLRGEPSFDAVFLGRNLNGIDPSRNYPLRVWVDDFEALKGRFELATSHWERELLLNKEEELFSFVEDRAEADIIVLAASMHIERGTACFLPEKSGGVACRPLFKNSPSIILLRGDNLTDLLHELGHIAFNLAHNPDPTSIMNPNPDSATDVTEKDRAAAIYYLRKHGVSVP